MARSTETKIRTFVISTFLLVSGLILTASGFLIYRAAEDFAIQQYLTQLQAAVSTTAAAIDGERHKQFKQSSKAASAAYRHQLRAVQELLHNKRLTLAFSLNVSTDAKHLTYALLPDRMQKDRNLSVGAQFNDTREVRQFLQSVIHRAPVNSKSQHVDFNWLPSQFGRVYMIAAPIYDLKLQTVGVLVVGGTEQQLLGLGSEIFKNMMLGFAVLAVGMLLASILFARKIARPVEQLDNAIRRLIENDFNYRLSEQAFGKFDYLAQQFNLMLAKLHNSRNELIKLNKAYSRFVPHQLLKQLSPGGVKEIQLGDCCERLMTVLFCDIRGFTSLSETMSPQANFQFINRYLSLIAPVINQHGGIIDKYLGDGVMALFPNADAAVQAAVDIQRQLEHHSQKLKDANLIPIRVGMGLHTGMMMMGTVGSNQRMDVTVVSDSVNAAARIESMTKAFATDILISGETKNELKELSRYRIRYIAHTRIQGKSKPVTLYEVFDHNPLSLQQEKLSYQNEMIRAWKFYREGAAEKAIEIYQQLLERSPEDKSLMALIERCQSGRL